MAAGGDSVTNKLFAPPLGTVRHNYRKVSRHGRGPSGSLGAMSVDGNDESDGALLESSPPRGPSPVAEYNEAIIKETGGAWQLAEMVVLAVRKVREVAPGSLGRLLYGEASLPCYETPDIFECDVRLVTVCSVTVYGHYSHYVIVYGDCVM